MTDIPPLPVTVISGYLGSGKTSLINHILRHAEGRRIMVMVNDFGALNIDADLLESAEEDTLTLSNGCICCTMGTELLYALSDALDRRPRPDFLVIEASGVADPQKIAAAAHAEPEMRYCGVVATVDAANIGALLADNRIGHQVAGQLEGADLALITKTDLAPLDEAIQAFRRYSEAPALEAPRGAAPIDLILGEKDALPKESAAHHHGEVYQSWSTDSGVIARDDLAALLKSPPPGLYRFKGRIALREGGTVEAHLVGRTWELIPAKEGPTRAVAIGVIPAFDVAAFDEHWREMTGAI